MSKRLGRGYGSGKGGHTSGRGQKGQKSRTDIHILFQGLKVKKSTLKRLPLLRGRGKFSAKSKPVEIDIHKLKDLKKGEKVNVELLIKKSLVTKKDAISYGVKILGTSDFKKDLVFEVPVSK
ncbi:MAG: 50S ribosomal protein L15 [Candidatus Woesebacteria bacterium GW2011_GWA1_33_30]|uniref:50S ribosomal protein L15 n=1 Tax=Candidatus Woesebacteria bacterium GW2011_GWA2_33_28 TaxID=1618561 RepID=A0A0F9ZTY2_9BACT|nr:MAG: 50S ribosomal protein L15 [Candidatus Woesebacteria bacterium GW2011_GWA2_33_28]KKP48581.1 MAG: 50S ribosomal protein L15 [Candidatus Woesebacteria bacterium GW2011_GWA1_33_30]KKP49720.1 MAG: 50S ribosomal protein L15 [Microgenomates group bacterium GW2011_GWC1_33_32]KKP52337.1 MAG: 50S ribosomal protein L15 [Candidatus Woesebacteria bacterium GW2011_GWB1_33_38]KKP55905.1 MAG: 50S ribosomal protein L15 [Microgenomates group bacterium GW2011_GWD1_33_9]